MKTKTWILIAPVLTTLAVTGCNEDETAVGGETVDVDGEECGEFVNGREGSCWATHAEANSPEAAHYFNKSLSTPTTHTHLFNGEQVGGCCEPFASEASEDAECERACIRQMCIESKALHLEVAGDIGVACSNPGCGFDDTDCRTGDNHTHQMDLLGSNWDYSYDLDIDCETMGNQIRVEYPEGSGTYVFAWAIGQQAVGSSPPPTCGASAFHDEPAAPVGYNADGGGLSDVVVDWTDMFGGSGTEEASPDDVKMDYDLEPCGSDQCLALRTLRLRLPAFSVDGYLVDSAVMTVTPVGGAKPIVNRGGNFTYQAGELRAELEFDFDGGRFMRHALSTSKARGKHRPGHNVAKLRRVDFDYSGTAIDATMRIDIRADFENRRPEAEITPALEPVLCGDDVRFTAQSIDPDGDPMTHVWSVPQLGLTGTGNEFSAVLPPGDHPIVLVSTDDSGFRGATGLAYTRDCR